MLESGGDVINISYHLVASFRCDFSFYSLCVDVERRIRDSVMVNISGVRSTLI